MIDSHIHLDATEFDADRLELVAAARSAGVRGFLIPAVAPYNFGLVRDLAHQLGDAGYCLGIHPLYVMQVDEGAMAQLEAAVVAALEADDPRFLGIGEIGLDYFAPGLDRARQEHFYVAQLKLARRHGLPVILHVRRSQDDLLKWLRRMPVVGGIAHAFNGSADQARHFLEQGFKLGFGGAATYPGSQRIRRLAAQLPLSAIVIETDAPDIPPQWLDDGLGRTDSRQRNTPAQLPRIAAELAQLRGLTLGELVAATDVNTRTALPRLEGVLGLTNRRVVGRYAIDGADLLLLQGDETGVVGEHRSTPVESEALASAQVGRREGDGLSARPPRLTHPHPSPPLEGEGANAAASASLPSSN
jgi:TatD DNase family protein